MVSEREQSKEKRRLVKIKVAIRAIKDTQNKSSIPSQVYSVAPSWGRSAEILLSPSIFDDKGCLVSEYFLKQRK